MIQRVMKIFCLAIALLSELVCQLAIADQVRMDLQHDGDSRFYNLYIPTSYREDRQLPLVIVLHGRSGNGQRMADLTRFNSRADRHGFVVAYPEGIDNQWNYLHGISGFKAQPNDSDFLLELADAIRERYRIDTKRIYIAGISNGGFMAQRLACYAPGKFAAFASVAAGGFAAMPLDCNNNSPTSMIYVHGTADNKVPWQGMGIKDAEGNRQLVTMSIANSVKFWADHNHCGPDVASSEIQPAGESPGTQVKIFTSSGCNEGSEVVLYAVIGGGHNWPGAPDIIPPAIAGQVNMDFHASDVIWSFFKNKPLAN